MRMDILRSRKYFFAAIPEKGGQLIVPSNQNVSKIQDGKARMKTNMSRKRANL